MVLRYKDACNTNVQSSFKSLNAYFMSILIISGAISIAFIIINAISSVSPSFFTFYGGVIPPYIGIGVLSVFILSIFAVLVARRLKKNICGNDGMHYSLLG